MIRTFLFCLALILPACALADRSPALVWGDELTKIDLDRLFSILLSKGGREKG